MRKLIFGLFLVFFCTGFGYHQARAETYYISPTGTDTKNGTSESEAWATFNRAWKGLYPGDTLILLDGVYKQTLQPNVRAGQPGMPITIKAKNDGKAVIDGEFVRDVVRIGDWTPREWFVIEGIVGQNALRHVFYIHRGANNVLRRVSGYNASVDGNSAVFAVEYPEAQHNLIEDCIASGTGRKMVFTYGGLHNTFRRCFTAWTRWDGREFCTQEWPNGANLQFYGGSYNRIENGIAFGGVPKWNLSMGNQGNVITSTMRGNEILGSLALYAGMDWTGKPINFGTRPPVNTATCNGTQPRTANLNDWLYHRIGILADKQEGSIVEDMIMRDLFSYGNYAEGLGYFGPGGGFILDHVTITGNLGLARIEGPNPNLGQQSAPKFAPITNSYIAGSQYQDEGARLMNRYIDGVLTEQPLWPWPMEERVKNELGLSVTGIIKPLIESKGAVSPTLLAKMPLFLPINNIGSSKPPAPTSTPTSSTATNTPIAATATATKTLIPPTATATHTLIPPTVAPTNTPVPPTATHTPIPPTVAPTNTPVPPTATNTSIPPTVAPTNTTVPPTATRTAIPPTVAPTNTLVPPTATNTSIPPTVTATNTPVPPTATETAISETESPTALPVDPPVTITPITPEVEYGMITLRVDAQPNSRQNFVFDGDLGSFKLDDTQTTDNDPFDKTISYTVPSGAYRVHQRRQDSWVTTAIHCTEPERTLVDTVSRSVEINLSAGESIICTFVNQRRVNIHAFSFNDLNADGLYVDREAPLKTSELLLYTATDSLITHSPAGESGEVVFENQLAGVYKVCVLSEPGWLNTLPLTIDTNLRLPCHTVTIQPGQGAQVLFGNTQQTTISPNAVFNSAEGIRMVSMMDVDEEPASDEENQVQQRVYLPLVSR